MATAVLGCEGIETLDGLPYDKPCSPSNSGSGGGSNCGDEDGSIKEIETYVKFFTLKGVQVVVQSRLGKKLKTESNPFPSGTDWFYLRIDDNAAILEQTKEVLKSQSASSEIPIVIDISLQSLTDPNTKLVLELWSILYDKGTDPSTNSSKVTPNVYYNKMGLLLKSLVCVTRGLPAYRLSRKLSTEDEFNLCYNVFSALSLFKGENGTQFLKANKEPPSPHVANSPPNSKEFPSGGMLQEYIDYDNVLGEGYKMNQLGKVVTPYGTLTLEVAYRTKMELSSNFSQSFNKLMIDSDHYAAENAPGENPCQKGPGRPRNGSTPIPFGGMMCRENLRPLVPGSPRNSPTSSPITTNKKHLAAAFVDDPTMFSPIDDEADIDDDPLGNLLRKSMMLHQRRNQQNESKGKDDTAQDVQDGDGENSRTLTNDENETVVALEQDESSNDFVLLDFKMPFAGGCSTSSTVDNTDPIQFFQEVQQAPLSLDSLRSSGDPSASTITDEDLKTFESDMVTFDDFVKKLISSDQSPPGD